MKTLIKTSLTGLFLLAGCFVTEETTTIKITDPVLAIDADLDSGLISLQPSLDGTIVIERTLRFSNRPPTASSVVVDGVLQLRGECSFEIGLGICEVNYIVHTPPNVSVQAITKSGNIEIQGLVGPLLLSTSSGDIEASGASAVVDAQASSGNVTINDVQGDVTVGVSSGNISTERVNGDLVLATRSGNISLSTVVGDIDAETKSGNVTGSALTCDTFTASLSSGNLNVDFSTAVQGLFADLNSGNIEVTLPIDSYQIDTQTNSGDVTITNLIDDPTVTRSISAQTRSGDILLQGR
jgi:hypothetical protein